MRNSLFTTEEVENIMQQIKTHWRAHELQSVYSAENTQSNFENEINAHNALIALLTISEFKVSEEYKAKAINALLHSSNMEDNDLKLETIAIATQKFVEYDDHTAIILLANKYPEVKSYVRRFYECRENVFNTASYYNTTDETVKLLFDLGFSTDITDDYGVPFDFSRWSHLRNLQEERTINKGTTVRMNRGE